MVIRERTVTCIEMYKNGDTMVFDVPLTQAEVHIWANWARDMGAINKVAAIKMIRTVFSNPGLREAKWFVEDAMRESSSIEDF